jgi:multicomponent Na+:H+ antiporter subunit F
MIIEIVAFLFAGFTLIAGLWQLYAGSNIDRVFAFNILNIIIIVSLVWLADKLDNNVYLNIALLYGILSFISVAAITRVIESLQTEEKE